MAARGSWAKEQVWNKILETFPGAFVNEKEIRIPLYENGEKVEIKITLTCAKTNVGDAAGGVTTASAEIAESTISNEPVIAAPTEEEKRNITDFLARLGL